jgi:hypothetical protein
VQVLEQLVAVDHRERRPRLEPARCDLTIEAFLALGCAARDEDLAERRAVGR